MNEALEVSVGMMGKWSEPSVLEPEHVLSRKTNDRRRNLHRKWTKHGYVPWRILGLRLDSRLAKDGDFIKSGTNCRAMFPSSFWKKVIDGMSKIDNIHELRREF